MSNTERNPWINPSRAHLVSHRLLIVGAAVVSLMLAACSPRADATGPTPSAVSLAPATNPNALTQAFLDAQGTYCVRDIPGDCDIIDKYGLGYILGWCELKCEENPALTADFSGVNRQWWERNGLSAYPPFSYTGGVSESRLADGRRRLIVNIHGRNTFVALYALGSGSDALVGADFTEYPVFSAQPRMPVLGDVFLSAEVIVPANFEGMPDMTQFSFPVEGMEVRRLSLTITTRGPLRQAYDGIAAGTLVDVHGKFTFLPKLDGTKVNSRRLIANGFESVSRITVKPANAQ
jgi:hypothetical protein